MTATKFGVVISTGNAHIRRCYFPDSDAQLASYPLSSGESLVQVSVGPYPNTAAWQAAVDAAVLAAAGKPPGNPWCAVVDATGNVVAVIMADAAIDSVSGMTLVNDPTGTASIGWTWSIASGFVEPPPGIVHVKP
jgi:hypothetical protein